MTGVGNILHLTMEMFKHSTGTEIQAVPYRGDALVLNAVLAGEVQVAVVALAIAKPLIESGKIRALGITSAKRSAFMPDLPSISEAVPGFDSASWQALFAPAKTSKDIINLLQRETAKALASPDVKERLRSWTNEPVGSKPEVFEAYFREEVAKYRKVVKDIGMPQQD
jgi:tripartite-type tricarboxylate transporter receptor subunit TctC